MKDEPHETDALRLCCQEHCHEGIRRLAEQLAKSQNEADK